MYYLSTLALCLLCCGQELHALSYSQSMQKNNWSFGMVMLKNGDVLEGQVNFNYKLDIVTCKTKDGSTIASTPQNVKLFRFYDRYFSIDRVFVNHHYTNKSVKRKGFFEVLLWGALPVLGKIKLMNYHALQKQQKPNKKNKFVYNPHHGKLAIYQYFVEVNGKLVVIDGNEKTLLKYMKNNEYEMNDQLLKKQFSGRNTYTFLKLLEEYNKGEIRDVFRFDMKEYNPAG